MKKTLAKWADLLEDIASFVHAIARLVGWLTGEPPEEDDDDDED